MTTSSNGNIFRVTGPLWGEFTGHRWIPLTKAIDAELCCFLWSTPWINGWVNNRETGDLRCRRAHYDVIVMCKGWKQMRDGYSNYGIIIRITWHNEQIKNKLTLSVYLLIAEKLHHFIWTTELDTLFYKIRWFIFRLKFRGKSSHKLNSNRSSGKFS